MYVPLFSSPRLDFTRDGRVLVTVDDDAVTLVEIATATARRIAVEHAIAAVGFVDQVWIARGTTPVLERHALDGTLLATCPLEPASDGTLIAAPIGSPTAIWTSAPAQLVDEEGTTASVPGALALPVAGRRVVTASGNRVRMPSGMTCELGAGARIEGGVVVFDGAAVLVLAERTQGRELALVGLAAGGGRGFGHGRTSFRHPSPGCMARVAARRGLLALRVDREAIVVLDLRSGRVHAELPCPPEIADFALDPDGVQLALKAGSEIELVALADAIAARRPRDPEPPHTGATAPSEPAPAPRPEPATLALTAPPPPAPPAVESLDIIAPLLALAPRCRTPELPDDVSHRDRAIARLAGERDVVLARCVAGIAIGWDTRRLAFANDGAHPFEHEVAALLGTSQGFAEDHVVQTRRRRLAALVARGADRAEHFATSPLGELAQELSLSELELDIVMAIAAPTLWGEIARLYAVLANDAGRGVVDEQLVIQLLDDGASRYDIAAALAPDATLRRHGVVLAHGDRPRPFTPLAIDPVIAARLCGEPLPIPDAISVRAATTPLSELVVPVAEVRRIVDELARPHRAVRLAVRGRRGRGRRSVLAAIAAHADRSLGLVDVSALPDDVLSQQLRNLLRTASLCGLVPCLVGARPVEHGGRAIAEAVALHPGPVFAVLGVDDPAPFPPGHLELVLSDPTAGERLAHWTVTLARHGLRTADVEALAGRYRLTPGMVERAAAHVAASPTCRDAVDHAPALEVAIRQGRDARLARLATRVTRLPRWSDVVLPPDVLDSLRELIGRVRHGRRVFEEWGFDAVMTTGRGITALFDGRPGTGKTMVAGIVARELGLDLYRVDVSRLVSKWIGETEKHLAEIFDAVDDGQAIILFDEADSLFGKRTEVKSSNDRYANLEVNYLLQRIDSFDGIAILTTNFGSAIDPAFRRRVAFKLSFPFPDEEAREQLWRVHLPPKLPIDGPLDLHALARKFQLAGGYIRNACLRAAFLAAQEETALAQRHLERAVQLEYQQVGKISTSGPVD